MSEPQAHSYGSMPFGAHDEAERQEQVRADEQKERDMVQAHEAAVIRLMRPEVGAESSEAAKLVDVIGMDVIAAESDADLKVRVEEARAAVKADEYDPSDHNIGDVEAYAADHPDEVEGMLARERSGKDRVTLVAALEKILAPADGSDLGSADIDAGAGSQELGPVTQGEAHSTGDDADNA